MRLFERWERFDGQMRLKICNHALNTLQHLCVISEFVFLPGRAARDPKKKKENSFPVSRNRRVIGKQSAREINRALLLARERKRTPVVTRVFPLLLARSRGRQEGHQVEQRSTAIVPVLYELSGGPCLRLPAVARLRHNQSVSGEEGITGSRNIAREVNETLSRSSRPPDLPPLGPVVLQRNVLYCTKVI